jgi:hypothetical protein
MLLVSRYRGSCPPLVGLTHTLHWDYYIGCVSYKKHIVGLWSHVDKSKKKNGNALF